MRKNQILKLEFTPCVRKSGRRLAEGGPRAADKLVGNKRFLWGKANYVRRIRL